MHYYSTYGVVHWCFADVSLNLWGSMHRCDDVSGTSTPANEDAKDIHTAVEELKNEGT